MVWASFSSLARFLRKSWMMSVGKGIRVESVRIYRLSNLPRPLKQRLDWAQQEAARVWTMCRDLHREAREQAVPWPAGDDLQRATKGQFALHSQTVQMICHRFLTSVEITRKLKRQNPRVRYPYRNKRFATLSWPAQAASVEHGRVVLPMGRG
jgi:putative transposase